MDLGRGAADLGDDRRGSWVGCFAAMVSSFGLAAKVVTT
jgi:hypothetical protein